MFRRGVVAASLALACGLAAGAASADLLPPLLPGTTTSTPSVPTVPTLPPDPTGGVIGTVGGVVDTTTGTVTGAIDTVLGAVPGSSGGTLPTGTVDTILGTLLGGGTGTTGTTGGGTPTGTGAGGTSGSAGSGGAAGSNGGSSSGAAGSVVSGPAYGAADGKDHRAPALRFTILSKLRQAARSGKLRLRVHSSEPAVVAFTTRIRPGRAVRTHGRPARVSSKLIRIKPVVMAFRRSGSVVVVLQLPKRARKSLGHVASARVALQSWTSDLARNQARQNLRRTLRR